MTERHHEHGDGEGTSDDEPKMRSEIVGSIDTGALDREDPGSEDRTGATADRRGFGKLLLAGAAGVTGLAGLSGPATAGEEWYETEWSYADDVVPAYYEHLTTTEVVDRMIRTEAELTEFFDVLYERMDLGDAGVVAADVYPRPCGTPPLPDGWDEVVRDILQEIPIEQRCPLEPCPDPHPVFVPALTADIRASTGEAIVNIDPVGVSTGIHIDLEEWCWEEPSCDPMPDRWTEEGWGTLGEAGVNFDGEPIPVPY